MSRELAARLADLCGAKTKAPNQAIKRNLDRFPGDFIFDLSREEILRMSQSVMSLQKLRFSKRVRAFTEHGAVMAAMVLSSPRAVVMSVYVVRAFIKMREDFAAKILEEPADFMFRLTLDEAEAVRRSRSQIVTLKQGQNVKYPPYAFTEHGAIMAANVLNSPKATQMSVFVVRAFVKMRSAFGDTRELARKLALLEQDLKIRLNIHEAAIVDVLQRVMKILDPPPPPLEPPTPEIGFHVKEDALPYRVGRRAARKKLHPLAQKPSTW